MKIAFVSLYYNTISDNTDQLLKKYLKIYFGDSAEVELVENGFIKVRFDKNEMANTQELLELAADGFPNADIFIGEDSHFDFTLKEITVYYKQ